MRKIAIITSALALAVILSVPAIAFATDEEPEKVTLPNSSTETKTEELFTLEGVFYPSTSTSKYGGTWERIIYVFVSLNADKTNSIDTALHRLKDRHYLSAPTTFTIDEDNSYLDLWTFRSTKERNPIASELSSMGYKDAIENVILPAGSNDKLQLVFQFHISEDDYLYGKKAHLTFLDFNLDFDVPSIKYLESIEDLPKELAKIRGQHWEEIDGDWYSVDDYGYTYKNQWIDNCYVGEDGKMATDTWIDNYYVGTDGLWIPNKEK